MVVHVFAIVLHFSTSTTPRPSSLPSSRRIARRSDNLGTGVTAQITFRTKAVAAAAAKGRFGGLVAVVMATRAQRSNVISRRLRSPKRRWILSRALASLLTNRLQKGKINLHVISRKTPIDLPLAQSVRTASIYGSRWIGTCVLNSRFYVSGHLRAPRCCCYPGR